MPVVMCFYISPEMSSAVMRIINENNIETSWTTKPDGSIALICDRHRVFEKYPPLYVFLWNRNCPFTCYSIDSNITFEQISLVYIEASSMIPYNISFIDDHDKTKYSGIDKSSSPYFLFTVGTSEYIDNIVDITNRNGMVVYHHSINDGFYNRIMISIDNVQDVLKLKLLIPSLSKVVLYINVSGLVPSRRIGIKTLFTRWLKRFYKIAWII